jgi:Reverse transcriptase (RNA-dependent DNA polymerase)
MVFYTRYKYYEYQVILFGLTKTLATYQEVNNDILRLFLDKIYICYFDNILVYLKDKEQHGIYIKQVLEVLVEKGFRLKLSKYNFYIRKIMFLGYVIILRKISLDPEKVRAITI